MSNLEKWQQQIVAWNEVNGINPSIDRQRHFVASEVDEFHNSKGTDKLIELGDYAFTVIYLSHLIAEAGKDWHTGLIDCLNLVRQHAAEKFVDAVIASNWTKYVQAKDTSLFRMSQEAATVAEKYKDRYKQVVPMRSNDGNYYFIRGMEQGADGEWHQKVLKPSSFVEARYYL